jgi:xanthine dehydrogenase molybdenum-binding subunit
MINAPDMPDVEIILIEEGEEGGPFGAKSVGEIAAVPSAPAVANAVNRALGLELTVLPLAPARIVEANARPRGAAPQPRRGLVP